MKDFNPLSSEHVEMLDKLREDIQKTPLTYDKRSYLPRKRLSAYIANEGITKAQMFLYNTGESPCCSGMDIKVIRQGSAKRASDNTLMTTSSVGWCRCCGALLIDSRYIRKPSCGE